MQITVSQFANGTTADAAAVNADLNTIAQAINGNIDATNIAAGSITDSLLAPSISPVTFRKDTLPNYVVSGLTVATSGSLSTTVLAGVAYVNGKRVTPSNQPITVIASKDTYLDLLDDGTVNPVPVNNNAAVGMTLSTNTDGTPALRIAKVVSSGTAITTVYQNARIGGVSTLADFFPGFDPLGNAVYPRSGDRAVGRYTRNAATSTGAPGASMVAWNGCPAVPFIAEANRTYVLHGFESVLSGFTGTGDLQFTFYLGTTSGAQTTKLGQRYVQVSTANGLNGFDFDFTFTTGPVSGYQFVSLYVTSSTWSGAMTINTDVANDRNGVYTVRKD